MKQNITDIIKGFGKKNILVIGDVMVDSYMWGRVDRISPEAPVPVIAVTGKEMRLGGAANVARNIVSLGAACSVIGVTGNDDMGKWFAKRCNFRIIDGCGLVTDSSRPTTVKTRVIAGSQHIVRVDEENDKPVNTQVTKKLIASVKNALKKKVDAIIFEDYDKGAITPELIHEVVDLANKKGIPVTVDPKKRNFGEYKNVTLFKPNFRELTAGLNISVKKGDPKAIYEATRSFCKEQKIEKLMVTLSEHGIWISNNKQYFALPSRVRDVADVSGAGDTVISVATLCLASGMDDKKVAEISNIAAGLVCEKVGVVPVEKDELIRECKAFFGE